MDEGMIVQFENAPDTITIIIHCICIHIVLLYILVITNLNVLLKF